MTYMGVAEKCGKQEEFFADWKGDNEQVDDVLFMGLRV